MSKPKTIFILSEHAYEIIYRGEIRAEIDDFCEVIAPPMTIETYPEYAQSLAEAEIIFSGWGAPKLDAEFMAQVPHLRAFLYGSGAIKGFVTDDFWEKEIPISSAWMANAVPVSEFAFSQVIFALKTGWQYVRAINEGVWNRMAWKLPGAYGSTVGLVSLGVIARYLIERLKTLDVKIIAYDPFVSAEEGAELGVEMVELDELFRRSDVVSLHTPWLPETVGLINGELVGSMKPNATLINTSRGAVINEPEMIEVLQQRPDLFAVLDVTYPEPPEEGSPLYSLSNVILTPHIAGSTGPECRRMGRYMIDECRRFLSGQPLQYQITQERSLIMA